MGVSSHSIMAFLCDPAIWQQSDIAPRDIVVPGANCLALEPHLYEHLRKGFPMRVRKGLDTGSRLATIYGGEPYECK